MNEINLRGKIMKNAMMFLIGFCVYVAIEIIYRNESYFYMGLDGGLLFVLIDKINDHISWDMDLIWQGIIGSCLVTFTELVIGMAMLYYPSIPVMWDYTNMPLNYYGVICLPFSIIWIFMSWVAIFLADAINYYAFEELPLPRYTLFKKIKFTFREKHCKF